MKKYHIPLLFISAFLVRLVGLNQSLWLDEATTAKVVQNYSFISIVEQFSPFDFHPPLYYLCMKAWTLFAGYSELALRMPSVIFSLIAGYFIYKTALCIVNEKKAFWALALFLFNPLIVYYSQEARMYMLTVCLLSIATYFVFAGGKQYRLSTKIYIGIFLSTSFAVFYGSIFYISAVLLLLFIQKKYSVFSVALFCVIVTIALLAPLTFSQFMHSKIALSNLAVWQNALGTVTLKNILLIPLKFAIGRIAFQPKWLYWFIAGIWSAFVWFKTLQGFTKYKSLLLLTTVPLILGIIFSYFSPLLSYFRFLYLLIPVTLATAYGISTRKSATIVIVGYLIFALIYLLLPQFHREDWKGVAKDIPQHSIVYAIPSSMDALTYYRADLKIRDLRLLSPESAPDTFVIVPYTADIYGIQTGGLFSSQKTINYRGLTVLFISY